MLDRSVAGIRPKLDLFFGNLRAALAASAASGVDRRRLEAFQVQAASLQERLYDCLEQADRADLAPVLKDLQVLAYRTRVLFGRPLPGVAWDDLPRLLSDVPRPSAAPPERVLRGRADASFSSGDLRDPRREVSLPERTLVADRPALSAPAEGPGAPTAVASPPAAPAVAPPATEFAAEPEPSEPEPLELVMPEPAALESAPPEPTGPEPAGPEPARPEAAPVRESGGLPAFGPILATCLIFLAGVTAGASLGGLYPPLTALACGALVLAAIRPRTAPVTV
jgi:hypothetical protein